MDPQTLWQMTLNDLQVELSKANFNMWFRDTFIAEDQGDAIVIGVPNTFYLDWIRGKYHKNIADTLRKYRPTIREVTYKIVPKVAPQPIELNSEAYTPPTKTKSPQPAQFDEPIILPPVGEAQPVISQSPDGLSTLTFNPINPVEDTPINHTPLDPSRVFDNFIVGNSNRLAFAVSQSASQEPGKKYNPLFLYGGVGLGKTHLAHAIGNEIKKKNPTIRITYVSCEVFTNEFIEALRGNQIDNFKKRYRHTDVLLIDDIQFMSGKGRTQEEFFHTFNALHQAKKQIVLTADQEPQNIPGLEDRLTSRFAWGMVADIQAPDLETRVAVLRAKCIERGEDLPEETIYAIAQTVQSNIRELEGALQRVLTQAELNRVTPDAGLVNQVLSAVAPAVRGRALSPTRVIEIVSKYFELEIKEVIGQRRYKELVYPRQLIMYLLRHELSYSYPKIAKELGGKDHTTIMHGVGKIEKELARNSNIQYDLSQLKEKIHQH